MLGVHVRLVGMVVLLSINSGMTSGRGDACDALFGTYGAGFAGGTKAGSADWMLGGFLRCRAADEPAKEFQSLITLGDNRFVHDRLHDSRVTKLEHQPAKSNV